MGFHSTSTLVFGVLAALASLVVVSGTLFVTDEEPQPQVVAVQGLVERLLGAAFVPQFDLALLPLGGCGSTNSTCFELHQPAAPTAPAPGPGSSLTPTTVVIVRGSTGVELAAGVGHYLRHVANVSFSWENTGGNNVERLTTTGVLPPLPKAAAKRYASASPR
jgi:alpha-N-acetylglucosaminidase